MNAIKKTILFRHKKENLKKCSLRGLEEREDILFFSYPQIKSIEEEGYLLLTPDAPPLTKEDRGHPLLLFDATWRLAEKMHKNIVLPAATLRRSLPEKFITAYPRRQEEFIDPTKGLASIEALYIAYAILGYETKGLLDHYYWKEQFLEKNQEAFDEEST